MGFPFDKRADPSIQQFEDFTSGYDNMRWLPVTIRHLSENTAQNGDDPNDMVKL